MLFLGIINGNVSSHEYIVPINKKWMSMDVKRIAEDSDCWNNDIVLKFQLLVWFKEVFSRKKTFETIEFAFLKLM